MTAGNLYTLNFYYGKDSIQGILIDANAEWSLLRFVPVDFQIDGYVLVKNSHLRKVHRSDEEIFKQEVISTKEPLCLDPCIDISGNIWEQLKDFDLIHIETYRNDVVFIGKVQNVLDSSIIFQPINTKGEFLDTEKRDFSKIWLIYFDTDYLNSFLSYLKKKEVKF